MKKSTIVNLLFGFALMATIVLTYVHELQIQEEIRTSISIVILLVWFFVYLIINRIQTKELCQGISQGLLNKVNEMRETEKESFIPKLVEVERFPIDDEWSIVIYALHGPIHGELLGNFIVVRETRKTCDFFESFRYLDNARDYAKKKVVEL